MSKIQVSLASDYAILRVDDLDFYYGYEVTNAPDDEDDDGDYEWCFQVTKGNKVEMKITTSELEELVPDVRNDEPERMLLAGIALWIQKQQL